MSSAMQEPRCPICGKPVVAKYHPFCSPRCQMVDLHRWLGETYKVETDETDIEERPD